MVLKKSLKNVYSVVLCGGKGERLWPYSRLARPKPFIPFLGNTTLIEQTINRAKLFSNKIWIVSEQHKLLNTIPIDSIDKILLEPCSKNTAAASLLSCLEIYSQNPEAIVVLLPADHFIPDGKAFANKIIEAIEVAGLDKICLLGIKASRPAINYGYIETVRIGDKFIVKKFHEKPDLKTANEYVTDPNKFWNLGVFIGRVTTFIKEFEQNAPDIYKDVRFYFENKDVFNYNNVKSISIDYAVVEHSKNIMMVPVEFSWNDIGSLDIFLDINKKTQDSSLIEFNAKNNLVDVKDKLVVLIGLDDLCIVDQNDVLVIVAKQYIEEVKSVVKILKANDQEQFC